MLYLANRVLFHSSSFTLATAVLVVLLSTVLPAPLSKHTREAASFPAFAGCVLWMLHRVCVRRGAPEGESMYANIPFWVLVCATTAASPAGEHAFAFGLAAYGLVSVNRFFVWAVWFPCNVVLALNPGYWLALLPPFAAAVLMSLVGVVPLPSP